MSRILPRVPLNVSLPTLSAHHRVTTGTGGTGAGTGSRNRYRSPHTRHPTLWTVCVLMCVLCRPGFPDYSRASYLTRPSRRLASRVVRILLTPRAAGETHFVRQCGFSQTPAKSHQNMNACLEDGETFKSLSMPKPQLTTPVRHKRQHATPASFRRYGRSAGLRVARGGTHEEHWLRVSRLHSWKRSTATS